MKRFLKNDRWFYFLWVGAGLFLTIFGILGQRKLPDYWISSAVGIAAIFAPVIVYIINKVTR